MKTISLNEINEYIDWFFAENIDHLLEPMEFLYLSNDLNLQHEITKRIRAFATVLMNKRTVLLCLRSKSMKFVLILSWRSFVSKLTWSGVKPNKINKLFVKVLTVKRLFFPSVCVGANERYEGFWWTCNSSARKRSNRKEIRRHDESTKSFETYRMMSKEEQVWRTSSFLKLKINEWKSLTEQNSMVKEEEEETI